MNRAVLKEKAKASLKGKYGEAIKLMAVSFLISFVVGLALGLIGSMVGLSEETIDLISNILEMFITALFTFGTLSFYLKISRNEEVTYKELFSKVNMFWPYLAISLLTGLFTFFWTLLFIIPGIIAAMSYSLVYFIKLDNPELGAMEIIKKSKEMMKGHKWEFFVLELSFIGWIFLGVFTIGILYLWLVPYMEVTFANFYNSLKENKATE